jgi:hypothetical protein
MPQDNGASANAETGSRKRGQEVVPVPTGFDPARLPYLDRLHPQPAVPDWGDVEEVAQWIEGTRWRAFFAGARHEEISKAEANALVAALSERARA